MANPFSGGKNSDMYKGKSKDEPKVMSRQDFSDEKIGPKFDVEKKEKPKAKAKPKTEVKKLKDTSSEYWSADGITGDIGSVNSEEGSAPKYKAGGAVKSPKNKSASSRADGIAVRGKTRA